MSLYQEIKNILTYRGGPGTYINRYYRARREFVEPWKFPMYLYHKAAKELWRDNYIQNFNSGYNTLDKKALLVTHITPFYRDPTTYDPRPGRWSKVENARILNKFGFSVDVYDILGANHPPENLDEYDIIMGKGSVFEQYARDVRDDTLIILYETGMPQGQVTESYRRRIDEIQDRKGIDFSPERPNFFDESPGEQLADAIIVMGDEYTAEMFEKYVPGKPVYNISTTHTPGFETNIGQKDYTQARKNFLWFGGTGAVLKGLDRVLDVFDQRDDISLYVCGPIRNNNDFFQLYEDVLYENDNIHPMGWTDIRSSRFKRLTEKCGYILYPSATEGSSGAIAACRWRGVVPIVTKEVLAETDGWGVTMPDDSLATIESVVSEYSQIDPDELAAMTEANYKAARTQYDQDHYSQRLSTIFVDLFDQFDIEYPSDISTDSSS